MTALPTPPTDYYENFTSNETLPCISEDATLFNALVTFAYSTIVVVSLFGNGIIAYLVFFKTKFRSVTNFFIVNLSVGDMFMTLYCVPFTFISTIILQHWPFGDELCRTVSYFQAVSVFVSAYTLVAISLDRYICIMHPLRPRITKSHAKVIIGLVWLVALLTGLPIAVVSQVILPENNCGRLACIEVWHSASRHFTYSVALMVLQYGVPFTVLVFTYTRIAVEVWGRRTPGEAENARDTRLASRKRKMIKMMVIVVIVYTVCWLPYNILLILMGEDHEMSEWAGIKYIYFGLHWLAMSHTCYNPAIYVYMNNRYKTGFHSVLSKVPCIGKLLPQLPFDNGRGTSFAMTGVDPDSSLRRVNTCTTYVSRAKNGTSASSLLVRGIANDF